MTSRRLIETAFPLKQVSLDSVHEKNVRHGHISTLHIWPARRPLAASRAALLATLLPAPADPAERRALLRLMAGEVVDKTNRDGEKIGETTRIGVHQALRDDGRLVMVFANKSPDAWETLVSAPAGACILYALSCNLSDADLAGRFDLLARGNQADAASEDDDERAEPTSRSESRLKAAPPKTWANPPPTAPRPPSSTASTA